MENHYFHQNSEGWTEILNNITPDLHFIGSDGFATAHCCILRNISPLIDSLYSKGDRSEILTVLIPDVSLEIIQGVIELIYLGDKNVHTYKEVSSIMELLAMLRIDRIRISIDKTTFSTTPVTNIASSTSSTKQEGDIISSDPLNNPLISLDDTNHCKPEEITVKHEEFEYEEEEMLEEEASIMDTEETVSIDEESELEIPEDSKISLEMWNPALDTEDKEISSLAFPIPLATVLGRPPDIRLLSPDSRRELINTRFPSWESYQVANDDRMKMMGREINERTASLKYCSFCDKTFGKLWGHAKRKHVEYDERFKIKCDFPNCSKRFLNSSQLERHRLEHGLKPIGPSPLERRRLFPPKKPVGS